MSASTPIGPIRPIGPFEAVIFDMDGVIVDSEPRHERAFHAVVDEIGFTGKHRLRFADYVGRTDRVLWEDFVARFQPPFSLEELLSRKRVKVLEMLRSEHPLFPGVPDLLRELSSTVPLALASGSERPIVDEVLGLARIGECFKLSVSGSEVPKGKPEPDIFLTAARLLGVSPSVCVAVEDSRPGVAAAQAAGMRVIAITNTHAATELVEANRIVRNYGELRKMLLEGRNGSSSPA